MKKMKKIQKKNLVLKKKRTPLKKRAVLKIAKKKKDVGSPIMKKIPEPKEVLKPKENIEKPTDEIIDVFEKAVPALAQSDVHEDLIRSIRIMPLVMSSEFPQEKIEKIIVSIPQASQLQKIQELTLVRVLRILAWPAIKIFTAIYWLCKFHVIKRKKKQYIIKYLEAVEKESHVLDVFSKPDKVEMWGLIMPHNWKRVLVSFIVVGIMLILPFQGLDYYEDINSVKEKMLQNSLVALSSLREGQNAIQNMDLRSAAENFEKAKVNFELAKLEFSKLNVFTRTLATKLPKKGKNIQASLNLLDAGENIAQAGENLSLSIYSLMDDFSISKDITESTLQKISVLRESFNFIIPKIAQAKEEIINIDMDGLTASNKNAIYSVQKTLPDIEEKLQDLSTLTDATLHVLGYDYWQRYLILFENSNEMRATGGFLGSYALIDIDKGKIKNIEIPRGGSYDLQGDLLALVESPKPLHIINPVWEFQDSNWWPDFPTSAKKINWFYQKSLGPSVHGIVAITSNFMEDVLGVIGPIKMEKYQRMITSDNFVDETQKIVELEYDKIENKPKQFIADMAPEVIQKISELDQGSQENLFNVLYKGLKEKQILLFSFYENIQAIIEDLEWGGVQAKDVSGDYLSVIHTNIAGNKTDGVITDDIEQFIDVSEDGSIIDTITITRSHNGIKGDLFTGVQNNDYIRIYVPEGSTLISAEGFMGPDENLFEMAPEGYRQDEDLKKIEGIHTIDPVSGTEIYTENNKTVFANWILTKPGEVRTAKIQYKLPFTLKSPNAMYSILVQKQAGSRGSNYTLKFSIPNSRSMVEIYPENISIHKQDGLKTYIQDIDILTVDKFYGIVVK